MVTFEDIASAKRGLRRYAATAEGVLPADTLDELEALIDSPSPVDTIARSAELLYARSDELDDAGRELVGGLASFSATNGWHGMATNNRGGLIAQAMRRELGTRTAPGQAKPQKAENDPVPAREFVRPPEAPEAVA